MYLKFKNWGQSVTAKVGKLTVTPTMNITTTLCDEPHVIGTENFGNVLTVKGSETDFDYVDVGTNLAQRYRFNANPVDFVNWNPDASLGYTYNYVRLQVPYQGAQTRNFIIEQVTSNPQPPYIVEDVSYLQDMRQYNIFAVFKNFRFIAAQGGGPLANQSHFAMAKVTYLGTPSIGGNDVTWSNFYGRYDPWDNVGNTDINSAAETFFCECEHNGEKYIGLLFHLYDSWTDGYNWQTHEYTETPNLNGFVFKGIPAKYFSDDDIATVDYGENSEADGGYSGTFDDTTENVGYTGDSTDVFSQIITAGNRGFHVYSIDNIQYNDLISDFMKHNQSLSIFNKEPWESILGVYKLPFTVNLTSQNYDVQANGYVIKDENEQDVRAPQITETTRTVNIGEIQISPYFDNFMDFSPYTKIQIFLPFIGFRDIPVNDVMGGSIRVEYKFDVLTGNCNALLYCKNRFGASDLLASYTGNCAVQLPMYGSRGNAGQILGAVAGIAAGVLTENVGAVAGGAMGLATMQNSPNVSSQYNGNMGILSNRQTYLIITRAVPSIPEHFEKYRGYTSDITTKISDLTGFTKFSDIHVDEIEGATADEKEEIERILKTGFIA